MKKLILTFLFAVIGLVASAQVIEFQTTSFTEKHLNSYGYWTGWSPLESSSMKLRLDLDEDEVIIYSPKKQIYQIVEYVGNYVDRDGDETLEYRFIDQDYNRGTLRLMQRRNGRSEVYILFNTVILCYSVIRR